jgi:LysR family transcriptional regulator, chromosome initiation inhibitor
MLDYPSLLALAAVVREGSFERAARALSVTTSALSQRVKSLEDRLGSVLVVRGRPCAATEIGRLLCRHVEQVAMLEQDLRKGLPKLAPGPTEGGSPAIRLAVSTGGPAPARGHPDGAPARTHVVGAALLAVRTTASSGSEPSYPGDRGRGS